MLLIQIIALDSIGACLDLHFQVNVHLTESSVKDGEDVCWVTGILAYQPDQFHHGALKLLKLIKI